MVVWECELLHRTAETIGKVAQWLRQANNPSAQPVRYASAVDREKILAVAERQVHYRIATYDEKREPGDSETTEVERP